MTCEYSKYLITEENTYEITIGKEESSNNTEKNKC